MLALWVKTPTEAVQIAAKVQVRSLARRSGLKDLAVVAAATKVLAVACIQFLVQEHPYATGAAIKNKKQKQASKQKNPEDK